MRVPGGDAVQRAYAVRAPAGTGAGELLVIEIHNQTSIPFAVAVALRPYNAEGPAGIGRIEIAEATVTVSGRPALLLPGPPRLMAGSTRAEGDVAVVVAAGGARHVLPEPRQGDDGVAFLYPLAHTATLRFAIPLDPSPAGRSARRSRGHGSHGSAEPSSNGPATPLAAWLPSAADAARAWQAHTRRGLRLELPAGRLADAVEANRRYLLLFDATGADRAALAIALEQYGLGAEAAEMAAGPTLRRSRPSRRRGPTAGPAIDLVEVLRSAAADLEAHDRGALAKLEWLLDVATSTWTWPAAIDPGLGRGCRGDGHDGAVAARFCSLVRDLMVREVPGGLALLTLLPTGWLGQPIEVHAAPTGAGRLSYAVRWHGERPALLWELERPAGTDPVRLTIPGLDGGWSTADPTGEALLAPMAGAEP